MWKHTIISLVSGFLFAIGLGISGMTNPAKVQGFLDFFGSWEPDLMFVMGGAVVVYYIAYRFIAHRQVTLFSEKLSLPTKSTIDGRLLGGAALFGAGWGLGGLCPGPAIVSLPTSAGHIAVFVVAMLAGMKLLPYVEALRERRIRRGGEAWTRA
jgi:uncharacterized membrane protein YedE/YeeE